MHTSDHHSQCKVYTHWKGLPKTHIQIKASCTAVILHLCLTHMLSLVHSKSELYNYVAVHYRFSTTEWNDAQTRSFHYMLLSHVCTAADFVGPSCCNRHIEFIMKQTEVYPGTTCNQFLTDRLYSRTKHCFVHMAIRSQLAWERYYPSAFLKNSFTFTPSTFLSLVQHSLALDINSYTVSLCTKF